MSLRTTHATTTDAETSGKSRNGIWTGVYNWPRDILQLLLSALIVLGFCEDGRREDTQARQRTRATRTRDRKAKGTSKQKPKRQPSPEILRHIHHPHPYLTRARDDFKDHSYAYDEVSRGLDRLIFGKDELEWRGIKAGERWRDILEGSVHNKTMLVWDASNDLNDPRNSCSFMCVALLLLLSVPVSLPLSLSFPSLSLSLLSLISFCSCCCCRR